MNWTNMMSSKGQVYDLIITNEDDLVHNISYYPPIGKSHHSLVYFSIDAVLDKPVETPVLKYMITKLILTK